MKNIEDIRVYALEQIRRYLITTDTEIKTKEDFKRLYFDMFNEGYLYEADVQRKLDGVKSIITDLSSAYLKDKNIIEEDLIFFGAKRVLEKIDKNKRKR